MFLDKLIYLGHDDISLPTGYQIVGRANDRPDVEEKEYSKYKWIGTAAEFKEHEKEIIKYLQKSAVSSVRWWREEYGEDHACFTCVQIAPLTMWEKRSKAEDEEMYQRNRLRKILNGDYIID